MAVSNLPPRKLFFDTRFIGIYPKIPNVSINLKKSGVSIESLFRDKVKSVIKYKAFEYVKTDVF